MSPAGLSLLHPPISLLLAAVALALSAAALALGAPLLRRALSERERPESPVLLLRGGRALIVSIAGLCIAGGLWQEARGILYFGLGFLAEEIYETGMALLILREGRKRELRRARRAPLSPAAASA